MSKARGPYRVDPLRYKKANEALDKKAENARELGLDYEPVWNNLPSNKDVEDAMRLKRLSRLAEQPAQQEPVACSVCDQVHSILDGDASKIIRNAQDGYPDGRSSRILTLQERVMALCRYASDWKRWCLEKESTSPPAQRTWVGLTDEEYREAGKAVWAVISLDDTEKEANREFYEAIEAKLKEKNT